MIRSFATSIVKSVKVSRLAFPLQQYHSLKIKPILTHRQIFRFADYPKHQVLTMPALSPTMTEGKVVKWIKKVGDKVEAGDVIAEIQTDKATVGFEVQQNGFIAKVNEGSDMISVGTPVVILTRKQDSIKQFEGYKFAQGQAAGQQAPKKQQGSQKQGSQKQGPQKQGPQKQTPKKQEGSTKQAPRKQEEAPSKETQKQGQPTKQDSSASKSKQPAKQSSKQASKGASKSYPKHNKLAMPALSPTMTEGKIIKWNIKQGQSFEPGDSLCSVETDKATVDFEASEKGYLAKVLAQDDQMIPIGQIVALSVRKKQDVDKFNDFTLEVPEQQVKEAGQDKQKETGAVRQEAQQKGQQPQSKKSQQNQSKKSESNSSSANQSSRDSGDRIVASPAARFAANQKGINLSDLKGKGSGPDGRIIRQDVDGYQAPTQETAVQKPVAQKPVAQKPAAQKTGAQKAGKITVPENPFEEVPLSGMRKTIAARLLESKTTIPHYYINLAINMDSINDVRNELNKNEKEFGVKISVNDIILKAMALALRDYPDVNAQWHGKSVKKFKHADIGVAVATEGGLITPIVFRAETLGFVDIARRTKDIAKRARQGKLDPAEYIGGTSTISNLGMFGIDAVTSVINPPQSTILGVGRTDKKIIFDSGSLNPDKPYRVASMCEMIVSADHRVVDGALAAQWIKRIQFYLENPSNMLM